MRDTMHHAFARGIGPHLLMALAFSLLLATANVSAQPGSGERPQPVRPPNPTVGRANNTPDTAVGGARSQSIARRVETALERGNKARDAQRYADAEAQYRRALLLNPSEPRAFYGLGNVLREQDRNVDAVGAYEEAIELKPDYADAHWALASAYASLNRNEEALREYRKLIRLQSKWAVAHWALGYHLSVSGMSRPDEEIAAYKEAVRLAPNEAEWLIDLGKAYRRSGRAAEAISAFERAVELKSKPGSTPGRYEIRGLLPRAHYELGSTYLHLYDLSGEARHLKAAEDELRQLGDLASGSGYDELDSYHSRLQSEVQDRKVKAVEPKVP